MRTLPWLASPQLGRFLSACRWTLAFLLASSAVVPLHAQVSGSMDVWPRNSTVEIGATTQFGAYVPITPNTITWSVNGITGGNATLGTISASGLYQAPAVAPTNNVLTIRAQSTAYATSFASTSLTVTR